MIRTLVRDLDAVVGRDNGLRGQLVGYAAAAALEGVCIALLVPVLRRILAGDPGGALPWVGGAAAAAVAAGLVMWVVENRAYRVGVADAACGAMRRLGAHATTLPLGWFDTAHRGRLTRLVTESTSVLMTVPGLIVRNLVTVTVTPAVVVVVAAVLDWRLAVAMVVFVPVGFLAYRRVQRVVTPEYEAVAGTEDEVASRVVEFAQAQPVLRAANLAERGWDRLDEALRDNRGAVLRELRRTSTPMTTFMVVVELGFVLVLATAVWLATTASGGADPVDLLVLLVLAVRFREPLSMLAGFGEGIALARVSLAGIRSVLDEPPLPEPAVPRAAAGHDVAVEGIGFGYTEVAVLDGVSLRVPTGGMTALVGPSGSGKTTVTRLVARFFDVDAGAVRHGGTDVRERGTAGVMADVALVFQHVYLVDATIEENVRLARPDATDDEVRAAAGAARLDEVVARLPLGWASPVGEGGRLLSGGERQRVSLARAFLKDAPIVLLDEATSALDGENEAAVAAAIRELTRDRTVLVVAHRLRTIAAADHIVHLDRGRVTEQGTHAELLARGGAYAALWAERSAAARWRLGRG